MAGTAKPPAMVFPRAKRWGAWLVPIGVGDVKSTNLNIFLHFGIALANLDKISAGMKVGEVWTDFIPPYDYTLHFLTETEG
jgi:hypothetical protein